jgi:hypothetical protein
MEERLFFKIFPSYKMTLGESRRSISTISSASSSDFEFFGGLKYNLPANFSTAFLCDSEGSGCLPNGK